jgi:Sec-independent protein translocase protein TatA
MILSNIANPLNHLDRLSVLRIRNATSYLREAVLDLSDFIDEQRMAFEELKEELAHQFFNYALKYASASLQNSSKAELGELQATQQRLEGELRAKSSECNKLNKDLLETRSQL